MSNENVQQEMAAALSREEPLTMAECTQLILRVHQAQTSVGERLGRISPATAHAPAGVEYLRVLRVGTPAEVSALEEEHKTLRILADQLQAQRAELNQRRMDARFHEARVGLPAMQSSFAERVSEVEQAKANLDRCVAVLVEANQQIAQARGIVRERQGEPAGASPKTLHRLRTLSDVFPIGISRHPNWWMDNIGCAISERVMREAHAKAYGVDLSDCTTDAEVMRAVLAANGATNVESMPEGEVSRAFGMLGWHGVEAA